MIFEKTINISSGYSSANLPVSSGHAVIFNGATNELPDSFRKPSGLLPVPEQDRRGADLKDLPVTLPVPSGTFRFSE